MDLPVTYDRRSFIIHKKPTLILSGSVHYPRLHPSRWQTLFDTFHKAYLNTLETYVFWHEHDNSPLQPTFSDRLDLFAFLSAAHHNNLYVILRIGPYVCAEASYGGLPFRLRDIPGINFRTRNVAFQKEVDSWVRYLAAQLHQRKLLASEGGPVILVQLENEYSMVSDAYGDAGAAYLQWMADLQRELSFGVPGIMCYGAADGVVETINAFYAHEALGEQRERHADQPPVWTECWTGWYDVWGAPHHVRAAEDLAYAVARFFASGGAGVNYYMWMGGTNFGRACMYLQKSSYDYDAPVDEFYQMTTKGKHLGRLHSVLLKRFAEEFHKNREVEPVEEGGVFCWGETVFVCNDGEGILRDVRIGNERTYNNDIRPRSVHIIDVQGELLFDTSQVHKDDIVRTACTRVETKIVDGWRMVAERVPRPGNVKEIAQGRVVAVGDEPAEQLGLTRDKSDYCFYTARYVRCGDVKDKVRVEFEAGDFAQVFFDGKVVGKSRTPLWEDRWSNRWNHYKSGAEPGWRNDIMVEVEGKEAMDVSVLVAALGLVKGDWQLEEGKNMLDERKGLLSDVWVEGYERLGVWNAVAGLEGEVKKFWEGFEEGEVEEMGWYRCVIKVKEMATNWVVDLGECDKGMIYVNEQFLGRFWLVGGVRPRNGFLNGSPVRQVGTGEPSQRFYHVPGWMGREVDDGVELAFTLFAEMGTRPSTIALYVMSVTN